jgi:hypothetical protein
MDIDLFELMAKAKKTMVHTIRLSAEEVLVCQVLFGKSEFVFCGKKTTRNISRKFASHLLEKAQSQ